MSIIHKYHRGEFYSEVRNIMIDAFYAYMASDEWIRLRQQAFDRDNNKCVDCGKTKRLTAHHTRYDNWGKGNSEELDDLVTVCQGCHTSRHSKMETPFWAKREADKYYYDNNSEHTTNYRGQMAKMINRVA